MCSASTFPPGPRGLPIIGSLTSSQPYPQRAFKKWSLEEYGPIMSVNMGSRTPVILTTVDAIKEALLENKLLTSSRPLSYLFDQKNGISFLPDDKKFQDQRSFGLNVLHSFATTGKLEEVITKEGNAFLQQLEKAMENPLDLAPIAYWMSGNILSLLLFGKSYAIDEKDALIYTNVFGDDFKKMVMIEFMPWLRHLPPFSGKLRRYWERRNAFRDAVARIVAEHKESFDEENLKDFMDFFIKEEKKQGAAAEGFTDDQLPVFVTDVLGAGITNAAITLVWMILCSLLYPESYKLIVKEVDNVLGKEDEPTWENRLKLPYTCAFMNEVYRTVSPLSRTVTHSTTGEVKLGDFILPAGTEISGSIWGAHHDPVTWPDPMKFDPGRHLDPDGNFVDSENLIPFGVGPRSCFAEHLAQVEVFIVFMKFVRHFEYSPSGELPGIYDGDEKITYDAKPFHVILKKRNLDVGEQKDNQETSKPNSDPEEPEENQEPST